MPVLNQIIESKYKQFCEMESGTLSEKLLSLGFVYNGNKTSVSDKEEFLKIMGECDCMDEKKLQMFYGDFLSYKDVLQILKVGQNGLNDNEIAEALKIIPVTPNLQISVSDFVKILYQ